MKVWKKNLVAAAVLVTVCAGIYVVCRATGLGADRVSILKLK